MVREQVWRKAWLAPATGLTSILLRVSVRLLTVRQLALLGPHKLPRPDHQGRVGTAHREQHRVIVQPSHVGDVGTVPHVPLESRVLALQSRKVAMTPLGVSLFLFLDYFIPVTL